MAVNVSPLYTAVMLFEPTGIAVVVNVAVLPVSGDVPSNLVPAKKETEPEGVPVPGGVTATAAESVTA